MTQLQTSETRPLRLLVVDDDPASSDTICSNLTQDKRGFEIDRAPGYLKGLDQIARDDHDCYLVASKLNGRGGVDLMREAKGRRLTSAPFIIIGEPADLEDERVALAEGAADWLGRDQYPPSLLRRSVRYAVDSHRSREVLSELSLVDPLTQMPTSTLFWHLMSHAFERAKRNKETLAAMAIYLSGLSAVNESVSWQAGDAVLRTQALRLRGMLRASDVVARLGGTKFVVLLEDMPDPAEVHVVAEKIVATVSPPIELESRSISVTPTIGIAFYPLSANSVQSLIRSATDAMDKAIAEGMSLRLA